MMILNLMIMMSLEAKKSLMPLLVNLLGTMKLRSLPIIPKGEYGSSQDMMIVVHLVPSSIIRIM